MVISPATDPVSTDIGTVSGTSPSLSETSRKTAITAITHQKQPSDIP